MSPRTAALVLAIVASGCRDDAVDGTQTSTTTGGMSSVGGASIGGASIGGASIGGAGGAGGVEHDGGSSATGGAPPESCDPLEPRDPAPEPVIAPEGFEDAIVAFIGGAESSLDIMMYQFTVQPIADAVVAAHQRGVSVRVMLDPDQNVNANVIATLEGAGIAVQDAPPSFEYAHAKVVIVDADRALVSSGNFNSYSMTTERNYAVIDTAWDDVEDLSAVFEHDWSGSPLDLSCTRLVVSPENARERLLSLISGATESLDLAVMYLSDAELRGAVEERAQAGVPVRALLADPAWIDNNTATAAELEAAGASVRFSMDYQLHAKLIVSDGVAFVGSENLSYTALTSNREIGVFVTEPAPAGAIGETFESDWASGQAP